MKPFHAIKLLRLFGLVFCSSVLMSGDISQTSYNGDILFLWNAFSVRNLTEFSGKKELNFFFILSISYNIGIFILRKSHMHCLQNSGEIKI